MVYHGYSWFTIVHHHVPSSLMALKMGICQVAPSLVGNLSWGPEVATVAVNMIYFVRLPKSRQVDARFTW